MITDDELNRLEALDKAATPGPWMFEREENGYAMVTARGAIAMEPVDWSELSGFWAAYGLADSESWSRYGGTNLEADFRFMAEARTAFPALIAEVRRLRRAGLRLAWCAVCEEDRVMDASGHLVCGHDKED